MMIGDLGCTNEGSPVVSNGAELQLEGQEWEE